MFILNIISFSIHETHNDPVIVCYKDLVVLVVGTSVIFHLVTWVVKFCIPGNTYVGLARITTTGSSYNSNNYLFQFVIIYIIIMCFDNSSSVKKYFSIQWWKLLVVQYKFHSSILNITIYFDIVKIELKFDSDSHFIFYYII